MPRDLATLLRETSVEPAVAVDANAVAAAAGRRRVLRRGIATACAVVAVVAVGLGGAQILEQRESAEVVFPPTLPTPEAVAPTPAAVDRTPEPTRPGPLFDPSSLRPMWGDDPNPFGYFGTKGAPLGPVGVQGVVVYAADADHGIVEGRAALSGDQLWTYQLRQLSPSGGEVDATSAFIGPHDRRVVLVSGQFGPVVALDVITGAELWRLPVALGGTPGAPTIKTGAVFVPVSYHGEADVRAPELIAVDMVSGDVMWRRTLVRGTDLLWYPPVLTDGYKENLVFVQDTPSHPGSAESSWLHAFTASEGKVAWRADLGSDQQGFHDDAPLWTADAVYARAPGTLTAVSLWTGKQRWQLRGPYEELVAASPEIVSVRRNGKLLELNAGDGSKAEQPSAIPENPLLDELYGELFPLVDRLGMRNVGGDHPWRDANTTLQTEDGDYVGLVVVLAAEADERVVKYVRRRTGESTIDGVTVQHGRAFGKFVSWFDCGKYTYKVDSESSPARRLVVRRAIEILGGC